MMFDIGGVHFSEDTEYEHCNKHLSVCSKADSLTDIGRNRFALRCGTSGISMSSG